jgi:hypothetical protein
MSESGIPGAKILIPNEVAMIVGALIAKTR